MVEVICFCEDDPKVDQAKKISSGRNVATAEGTERMSKRWAVASLSLLRLNGGGGFVLIRRGNRRRRRSGIKSKFPSPNAGGKNHINYQVINPS